MPVVAVVLSILLVLSGCAPRDNGPDAYSGGDMSQQAEVTAVPTPCQGAALGPRNRLVILDCATELSGTEDVLPHKVLIDNRSSRAVVVTTDAGSVEVAANSNGEISNTKSSAGWSLK